MHHSCEKSFQTVDVHASYTDLVLLGFFVVLYQKYQKGLKLWNHKNNSRFFNYLLQRHTFFTFHGSLELPLISLVCANAGKSLISIVSKFSLSLHNNFFKKHECISGNKCWISATSCVA